MGESLSFRAAAARVGCTHRAIGQAARAGRIPLQADGTVRAADVDTWHSGRRTRRGGANRKVHAARPPEPAVDTSARTAQNRQFVAPPVLGFDTPVRLAQDTGAGLQATTAACAIGTGAYNLACILARHGLPADRLVGIVMQWADWARWVWVGGHPEVAGSIAETDGWPPAPGGGAWAAHPLFMGDPLSDADWGAAAAIVDACQETLAGTGPTK